MKSKAIYLFASTILALALVFSAAAPSGKASPVPNHPEIDSALSSLHQAKSFLEHAKHDFGGHRSDALKATQEAIHQLEICQKY